MWRRIDEVPEGEAGLVWLYTVGYRVIGHQWRTLTRRSRLRSRLQTAESPPVVGADDSELDDVDSRRVLAALARLNETDAEVLRLDAWEQLSAASIAAVLEIEPSAARQRLHRARRNLTHNTTACYIALPLSPSLRWEVRYDHRRRNEAPAPTGRP